jgi:hypothetical protein
MKQNERKKKNMKETWGEKESEESMNDKEKKGKENR